MDTISRIICDELKLRAYTVSSLQTATELTAIHETTPNATVALGRAINAAALLGATMKPDSPQTVSLKFFGDGPIGEVHVQCDARGNIRGYVKNPRLDLTHDIGKISFSKSIGAGFLSVIRDLGMREPYTSTLPLLYGDVAGEVSYYLTTSEQIPSALIIALELDSEGAIAASGGILIQTFPDTPDHTIEELERRIKNMAKPLGKSLLEGEDTVTVLQGLFQYKDMEILEQVPLRAQCRCNRELLQETLQGIEEKELRDMIEKDKGAEVECTFCREKYTFSADDLEKIILKKGH